MNGEGSEAEKKGKGGMTPTPLWRDGEAAWPLSAWLLTGCSADGSRTERGHATGHRTAIGRTPSGRHAAAMTIKPKKQP